MKGDAKGFIKKKNKDNELEKAHKTNSTVGAVRSTGSPFRKEDLTLLVSGCPHPFSSF